MVESPFKLSAVKHEAEPPVSKLDVQKWLAEIPEEYVDCREGRHPYPKVRPQDMTFRRDSEGYDVFVVDCPDCGQAYREEKWVIVEDRHGNVTKMRMVKRQTRYKRPEGGGRSPYLLPKGSGYYSPLEIRESRVSAHFVATGGVKRYGGGHLADESEAKAG